MNTVEILLSMAEVAELEALGGDVESSARVAQLTTEAVGVLTSPVCVGWLRRKHFCRDGRRSYLL